MTSRREMLARAVHPGAWWCWAIGLAAAASRTTDPLVLALLVAVAGYVVSARRSPQAVRAFGFFVRLGVFVIVLRLIFETAFGAGLPGRVLLPLPSVPLPNWLGGIRLGGDVTAQGLIGAFDDGLQLAAMLACLGAANALASPRRLLRVLPGALYEAGVAVTVAMSFAPQVVRSAHRVRQARRLRGLGGSGPRAWTGVALGVLEGALESSVDLAAAMDARGFGRRGDVSPRRFRAAALGVLVGLMGVAAGGYGLLDASSPAVVGLPLLLTGAVLACAATVAGGRGLSRSRYRPDPWRAAEWLVVACGAAALGGVLLAGRLTPGALHPTVYPLAVPGLPWPVLAGALLGLAPAWCTPPPTPAVAATAAPEAVLVGAGR